MEGIQKRQPWGDGVADDDEDLSSSNAQLYTCPICMDVLFEPVTLTCGHSYCIDCLYKLEQQNKSKKECPACRARWREWPQTSFVLNELVKSNFPNRFRRGHLERLSEAQRVRELTRVDVEEQRANRGSILANEGKVFLIGLVALLLFIWQTRVSYAPIYSD